MSVKVEVSVETTADAKFIFANFEEVTLNNKGKGVVEVEFGERNILQWGIIGKPETSYTITLKPQGGKLDIGGEHPIKLAMAKGFSRAGGIRNFRVLQGA